LENKQKETKRKKVDLHLQVDESLKKSLMHLAIEKGTSVSKIAEEILLKQINEQNKIRGGEK
jgi:hypothetical protein